jgi:hypothetical protein
VAAAADTRAAILVRLTELEDLAATLGLTLELHAAALGPDALAALQADVEEAARCLEVALASPTPTVGPEGNGTGDDVP